MYLESEKDRTRTMLAGVPSSAEGIRLSEQKLGAHWHGTSWFFLMHIIAKAFTKLDEIPFSSLIRIPQNYGIENWLSASRLRNQINTLTQVFSRRGLESIECDKNGNLSIGKPLTSRELRQYADSQYEYAMGEGLVRYSPGYRCWLARSLPNFAERIWWHYMTAVFDSPKIYESPTGENTLRAMIYDIKERMKQKSLSYHDIEVWTDERTAHLSPLLSGWQRELIANNVLKPFKVGEVTFIAPRYFAETYEKLLEGVEQETETFNRITNLVDKLRKFPAFPIPLGNIEQIEVAKGLQRANVAVLVWESVAYNVPKYAYLVSREIFEEVENKIAYSYSKVPMSEFGDITLTEQIFKTLGRLRLFGQKLLPEAKVMGKDYRKQVEHVLDSLEEHGQSETLDLAGCVSPLESFNIVSLMENKAVVNPEMAFVIKYLSEFWYNLANEPSIGDIAFPSPSAVESVETEQIKDQITKKLENYFAT